MNKLKILDKSQIIFSLISYNGNNFEILKELEIDPLSIKTLRLILINKTYGEGTSYILLPSFFPNLSDLNVTATLSNYYISGACWDTKIIIEEDNKSKLNKINIHFPLRNRKLCLYCHSYERLEEFIIYSDLKINHNEFPEFLIKSDLIFKSLTTFHFIANGYNIIDLINDAIDKMPVLRDIQFVYFDEKLVKKILWKETIKKINIGKNKDISKYNPCYSIEELKQIFPDVNFSKIDDINIEKEIKEENINENKNREKEIKEDNINKSNKVNNNHNENNLLPITLIILVIIYLILKIFNLNL